jgi:L-fuconolactonase
VLDTHVHFWDPQHLRYPWLGDVPALNRPHTADILRDALPEPVDAIFIEAGAAVEEADAEIGWVRAAARTHPWIRGAVANIALEDPVRARAAIRRHGADPFVLGVRRNLQDEPAGFSEHAAFRAGVRELGEAALVFDACVREHQLREVAELAAACPQTTIVLDHVGKPRSASGAGSAAWRGALARLAERQNVVCKLSGLATELPAGTAGPVTVSVLRQALDIFGPGRCLYGSDWPIVGLATDYGSWLRLVREALSEYSTFDMRAVLYSNAARVYGLDSAAAHPGAARKDPA